MLYPTRYEPAVDCTDGPEPGTVRLQRFILSRWPATTQSAGIFNCRFVRGSQTTLSLHSEGRAGDIHIVQSARPEVGDEIARYLIRNYRQLGIQYLIWDRHSWKADRLPGFRWRSYSGTNPHTDHIHYEQTRKAAAELTEREIMATTRRLVCNIDAHGFWNGTGRYPSWDIFDNGGVVAKDGAPDVYDIEEHGLIPNHPITSASYDPVNNWLVLTSAADGGKFAYKVKA